MSIAIDLPAYLPTPPEMTQTAFFLFILVGYVTRSFTKNLDQDIQQTEWFRKRGKATRLIVKKLLDLFHHWPLGWGLMVYCGRVHPLVSGWLSFSDVFYVGAAIFLDDLPDVPRRVRGIFKSYSVFGELSTMLDEEEEKTPIPPS